MISEMSEGKKRSIVKSLLRLRGDSTKMYVALKATKEEIDT